MLPPPKQSSHSLSSALRDTETKVLVIGRTSPILSDDEEDSI